MATSGNVGRVHLKVQHLLVHALLVGFVFLLFLWLFFRPSRFKLSFANSAGQKKVRAEGRSQLWASGFGSGPRIRPSALQAGCCGIRGKAEFPFGEESFLFSPVGRKGNLSLLEVFFQGTEANGGLVFPHFSFYLQMWQF